MKKYIAIVAFVLVVLSVRAASAGFVCDLHMFPGSSAYGANGFVAFSEYSGADCTGSYLGNWVLCSSSPTSSLCPSDPNYQFSEAKLGAVLNQLTQAQVFNMRVGVAGGGTCVGGGWGTCMSQVITSAN